jgi:hypothetical protein
MIDLSEAPPASVFFAFCGAEMTLDTTDGSTLHRLYNLLARVGINKGSILVAFYVGSVCLTLLPLTIAALFTLFKTGVQSCTTQMSYFCDAGNIFLFLVSFPAILLLALTDQQMLSHALHTVQADGTVTISEADGETISKRGFRRFGKVNRVAQAVGVMAGCVTATFIFWGATAEKDGGWLAHEGHFFLIGYIYLYSMVLFVAVLAIYVIRSFFIAMSLRDLAKEAELHMLPLHPDKAGGLQQIGRLGLRNQYGLTFLGINIVLAMLTAYLFEPNQTLIVSTAVATASYLLVGPVIFVGPLLPFRACMIRNKADLMTGVALRMRIELENVRSRVESGVITADDEQLIERLRKIGTVIDELPIWPFDNATLKKFWGAYGGPILGALTVPITAIIKHLPFWKLFDWSTSASLVGS